ncbi:MAG: CDGSH iron-sulfur domain-containing protein [Chloroflexi bacterium]|nr:CDGSH iron-sulfur domain-containing protein [Chloroflexota bacterium]
MSKSSRAPHSRKAARYRIKVTENGPYLVSGGVPLSQQIICVDADGYAHGWREGEKYEALGEYALCRCGRSGHKPFCDATHLQVPFHGAETASRKPYLEQAREIDGPDLKLTDAEPLCAYSRFCQRAGTIWKLTEQSSDPEARKTAIEEAGDCPSGRLVEWEKDGAAIEPEFKPSIGVVKVPEEDKLGPLWVRGGIPIESVDGATYEVRNRVTLCRCGKSANKPFCDGKHLEG